MVTRDRRYGGSYRHCTRRFAAPAPAGLQPRSPFGPSIEALAVYLRFCCAIGFERLSALLGDVFSVTISDSASANLLKRTKPRFDDRAAVIARRIAESVIDCSDETSAQVACRNRWELVLLETEAVLHVVRPSRGMPVAQTIFGDRRPAVRVSNLFGAQQDHNSN